VILAAGRAQRPPAGTDNQEDAMADAAGPRAGMPQLDFATFPNQIFWLVVALVVLYLILSRMALPRIGSVMAERRDDHQRSRRAETYKLPGRRGRGGLSQGARRRPRRRCQGDRTGRADIQTDLDAAIAKADAEIAARTAESERRIAEIRDSAAEAVAAVAKDTAKEILGAFGVKADARSVTAAVTARLKGGAA
jgi:F-type H+-transporting ATPase subunit b